MKIKLSIQKRKLLSFLIALVFTIVLLRSLLVSETARISKVCNVWEEKLMANAHLINEEIQVQAFSVGES